MKGELPMGYTTDFEGQFDLDKPLAPAHRVYLKAFEDSRRMVRDAEKTALRPDPVRDAVGLPVGPEGSYFVGGDSGRGSDILDSNTAPGRKGWGSMDVSP
jgi:hypothetical protein